MTTNWNILGHDWAVDQLQKAIVHGRIGHAYLITGQAQIGRATLARALAQALNCTDEYLNNRPCGVCRSCRLIAAGRHPDVRHIEPDITGRGNAIIRIDQIRDLQHDLNLAAVEGRYKIAVLTDFEAANLSAANAFLKTLEEPPPHVILILTASDADALLPTITSRCRTLNLRPVSTPLVADILESRLGKPTAEAARLAHLANGRIGWAIAAAENEELVEAHAANLTLLRQALDSKRVGRFVLADQLQKQTDTLQDLLQSWMSFWRDIVLVSLGHGRGGELINLDQAAYIETLVRSQPADVLLESLHRTEKAIWQIERNGNIRLVLENLLLSFPRFTNPD